MALGSWAIQKVPLLRTSLFGLTYRREADCLTTLLMLRKKRCEQDADHGIEEKRDVVQAGEVGLGTNQKTQFLSKLVCLSEPEA